MRARAFWIVEPGRGEIRDALLPRRHAGEVRVRSVFGGISRGTESLVFRGGVPASQHALMRAPFQDGDFPAPVKYGYLNVGVVEAGPPALRGRAVFCLYPHQTRYVVPAAAVVPLPEDVPPRRAVLAGMLETALNATWDAAPRIGDRVLVVGAGTLGCCVARLLAGMLGVDVTLVDVDPARATVAATLGARFALPADAPMDCDLAFHASATAAGLQCALGHLGFEGEAWELSWYGDRAVDVALGAGFHSRRLAIRASQVGHVAPARRARRSLHQRLALALGLLRDPAFDAVLGDTIPFAGLPAALRRLARPGAPAGCPVVVYDEE